MKITRILALGVTAALATGLLAGCSANTDQTTVTVIGFPGLFSDQFQDLVIKPYEDAHPNVKIDYEQKSTSAETIGQVSGAAANQTYDLALVDKSAQGDANKQGIFEKLPADEVPNTADLIDLAKNADGFGPSIYIDSLALVYNTQSGTPAPTGWQDFWDSQYQGQVAMSIDNAFGLSLITALAKENGNDYRQSIDPEIAKLKELAAGQVQTFQPTPDVYSAVASGSAQLGLGWYARAKAFSNDNPSLGVVVPKNAGVALTPTINLVSNAPQKEEALDFLNYAIGSEAQTALAREGHYGSVNRNVSLSAEERAASASPEGGQLDGGVFPDWAYISTVQSDWIQRIKREVLAR
ncbi:extracellular solute-binding protein [Pseudoclavibacter sp. CFCC 13611]|uniref:extracellular solute-binding protein n=1 Tax=Pseudoclavibacter sp. CFCC 13611 TaxID=2615178 RepID=UPI001787F478|nr:extracellular solute-binding protein [Pseudoclavibacter sp. CFCC 13611]